MTSTSTSDEERAIAERLRVYTETFHAPALVQTETECDTNTNDAAGEQPTLHDVALALEQLHTQMCAADTEFCVCERRYKCECGESDECDCDADDYYTVKTPLRCFKAFSNCVWRVEMNLIAPLRHSGALCANQLFDKRAPALRFFSLDSAGNETVLLDIVRSIVKTGSGKKRRSHLHTHVRLWHGTENEQSFELKEGVKIGEDSIEFQFNYMD